MRNYYDNKNPQVNPQGYPQANPQGYQNQQNIQFNGNVYPANAQGHIYSQQNIQAQISPEQQVWELNQAYMCAQNLNQMYRKQIFERDAYITSLLNPVDKTVTAGKVYCNETENRLYYRYNIQENYVVTQRRTHCICNGRPIKMIRFKYDPKYKKTDDYCFTWIGVEGREVVVTCPCDQLYNKKFIDILVVNGAASMTGRDSPLKNAGYILSYANSSDKVERGFIYIPYNAGWMDTEEKYYYYKKRITNSITENNESGADMNLLCCDSEREEVSAARDIIRRIGVFSNKSTGIILLSYLVSAFLRTFYNNCGYVLNSILVVNDKCQETEKVLSSFLQIYNTGSDVLEVLSKEKSVEDILYVHKDDIIIFKEGAARGSEAYKAKKHLVDAVSSKRYRIGKKSYTTDSSVVVIGNDITFEFEKKYFNIFPLTDNDIDVNLLYKLDQKEIPTFIMYFAKYIEENDVDFGGILNKNHSSAVDIFEEKNIQMLYTILSSSLEIFTEYIEKVTGEKMSDLCGMDENLKDCIREYGEINEQYAKLNPVDEFVDRFTDMIYGDVCIVNDKMTGENILSPNSDGEKARVSLDKNYVYISEEDVQKYICRNSSDKKLMNIFLDDLKQCGYINAKYTKYCARPTVTDENKNKKRMKLLQIRRDIFDKDLFNKREESYVIEPEMEICNNDAELVKVALNEVSSGQQIYLALNHPKCNNGHILITGISGAGKTVGALNIIQAYLNAGISTVTIDLINGLRSDMMPKQFWRDNEDKIKIISVYNDGTGINLLERKDVITNEEVYSEKIEDVADRVTELINKTQRLGSRQRSTLNAAIQKTLEGNDDAVLMDVYKLLEDMGARDVKDKISLLSRRNVFGKASLDWKEILYKEPKITVFQLSGFPDNIKMLISEVILTDFLQYAMHKGNTDNPCVLWMDECQKANLSKDSTMDNILRLGRKLGINAILCTQYMKNGFKDDAENCLSTAYTKLIFKPSDSEAKMLARRYGINDHRELMGLEVGQCCAIGKFVDENNRLLKGEYQIVKFDLL